jgi:hypothetical protein
MYTNPHVDNQLLHYTQSSDRSRDFLGDAFKLSAEDRLMPVDIPVEQPGQDYYEGYLDFASTTVAPTGE